MLCILDTKPTFCENTLLNVQKTTTFECKSSNNLNAIPIVATIYNVVFGEFIHFDFFVRTNINHT